MLLVAVAVATGEMHVAAVAVEPGVMAVVCVAVASLYMHLAVAAVDVELICHVVASMLYRHCVDSSGSSDIA